MLKYGTKLNKPTFDHHAIAVIKKALNSMVDGNGPFTKNCQTWIENKTAVAKSFLTSSGTDALEMAALLADLKPGDEVIMPSFTFSSTANAIALRGAVPVFVDIRADTLNIDETLIEAAITRRTRAICPVHYAGVGCDMNRIMKIARHYKLWIIEDAAQAISATYRGKVLGSFGDFGAYSFHASKIITAGEGGALLIKNKHHVKRAEVLWEKGTNRAQLIRGEINKYTWIDVGSSFLMSDINAALLWTQFQIAPQLIRSRLKLWNTYHKAFASLEAQGLLRRPIIPSECRHNGHIYYILLPNVAQREKLRRHLRCNGIEACFHYVPLHSAPAGKRFGRTDSSMKVTNRISSTLLRLPIYPDLSQNDQRRIISSIFDFFKKSFR